MDSVLKIKDDPSGKGGPRSYTLAAPNQALEPTAYSFGFAYASGGGSLPALDVAKAPRGMHERLS